MPSEETVALGFTGVGGRGANLLSNCLRLEQVAITAVCDVQPRHLDAASQAIREEGRPAPSTYESHERMVTEADIDAVIICSPWRLHLPMAITAMRHGVDAGVEVGPASTVQECWELVRTAEETENRCMLLENCCYGDRELAVLRMVRNGRFGELVHCECGYGHDLRSGLVTGRDSRVKYGTDRDFRGINHAQRDADLYPTHGVGPMARMLDINRGNRFVALSTMSSKAVGLGDWASDHLPDDHPQRDVDWSHGDVITTTIRCANGETLVVTHDVSLPRPYSRMYHVQGTNGLWQGDRDDIHLEDRSPAHEWESFDGYKTEWEHPLWAEYRSAGVRGGHGGKDFLMLREFVAGVAGEDRLPIDVYDTATWTAVSALSEQSIALGGDPISVPDFTNGDWMVAERSFP